MKDFSTQKFFILLGALGAIGLVACLPENPPAVSPRIYSVTPTEGDVSVRPDRLVFVINGEKLVPFQEASRTRVMDSNYELHQVINANSGVEPGALKFIEEKMSLTGENIKTDNQKEPYISIDSTSECKPTLTFDGSGLNSYQSYYQQSPLTIAYTLSGESCAGKKLVLKYSSQSLLVIDMGNIGEKADCKFLSKSASRKSCLNYTALTDSVWQKFTYNVAGGSNLSDSCKAINAIGMFTLAGTSQSRVDDVGTLADGETVAITYTKVSAAGGEQLIVRWLELNNTQINPEIVNVTATGSKSAVTKPNNGSKIRTYSVTGTWNVQYTCSKN